MKLGGWQKIKVENVNAYSDVLAFLRKKEMVLSKGYRVLTV